MTTKPTTHDIQRIIVGNQVAIMTALQGIAHKIDALYVENELRMRIANTKDYWWGHFNELVGPMNDHDRDRTK